MKIKKKEWFYNNSFLKLGIWKLLGNTMGATSRAGTAHPSGEPAFTPGLSEVHVARSLVFCEVLCRLVFVLCDSDYPFGICQQFLVRLNIFHQNDIFVYKGNNKITELRTILQRESQNS
jgi:hypothetical protein